MSVTLTRLPSTSTERTMPRSPIESAGISGSLTLPTRDTGEMAAVTIAPPGGSGPPTASRPRGGRAIRCECQGVHRVAGRPPEVDPRVASARTGSTRRSQPDRMPGWSSNISSTNRHMTPRAASIRRWLSSVPSPRRATHDDEKRKW